MEHVLYREYLNRDEIVRFFTGPFRAEKDSLNDENDR